MVISILVATAASFNPRGARCPDRLMPPWRTAMARTEQEPSPISKSPHVGWLRSFCRRLRRYLNVKRTQVIQRREKGVAELVLELAGRVVVNDFKNRPWSSSPNLQISSR
ncbi:unnamed protein product [Urochloa humidicola]